MGASKAQLFTPAQNDVADLARALAHPARVAILQHLLKVNDCIGGELVDKLPLAQPTISRHLKELKTVGLIQGTISGNKVNYCINQKRWTQAQQLWQNFFAPTPDEQSCC
jgi:DNA-binding transcriptional ArsR family regulator